jgi:hypothetical protein
MAGRLGRRGVGGRRGARLGLIGTAAQDYAASDKGEQGEAVVAKHHVATPARRLRVSGSLCPSKGRDEMRRWRENQTLFCKT